MFEHERKSLGQTRVFPIWRQSIVAFVAGNTKERNDYVLVVVIACNLKPPKKQNRKEEETYAEKKTAKTIKQTVTTEPARKRDK